MCEACVIEGSAPPARERLPSGSPFRCEGPERPPRDAGRVACREVAAWILRSSAVEAHLCDPHRRESEAEDGGGIEGDVRFVRISRGEPCGAVEPLGPACRRPAAWARIVESERYACETHAGGSGA